MTDTTNGAGGCGCGADGGCGGGGGAQGATTAVAEVDPGGRTELGLSAAGAPSPVPSPGQLALGAEPGDVDVREIPREFRHARVIGQVTSLVPGEALVIAAPHAPTPLLNQIEQEVTGEFTFEYLLEGPQVWRVQVNRVTCC